MRIALTADPELPVPPVLYGGIERIVDLLAKGLHRRGHNVTLFAHPDSNSGVRLVPWPGRSSASASDTARNALVLAKEVYAGNFDLVHSFSRIAYLLPVPLQIPKLMTYQREISRRSVVWGRRLSRGSLSFSAISRAMMADVGDVGDWRLVYNGVALETYRFRSGRHAEAPLVFLGRIEAIKGPHIAIEAARRAGVPLVIAGNIPEAHRSWFQSHIAPHIDGERVSYIGPVDDRQKDELLGSARALLMPILWEEPFGIVMAEAMACGTPVIGFRRGAVPEVVGDGVGGFVVEDVAQMALAIAQVCDLDRGAVRARAGSLFSDRTIVEQYIGIYERLLSRNSSLGSAVEASQGGSLG